MVDVFLKQRSPFPALSDHSFVTWCSRCVCETMSYKYPQKKPHTLAQQCEQIRHCMVFYQQQQKQRVYNCIKLRRERRR